MKLCSQWLHRRQQRCSCLVSLGLPLTLVALGCKNYIKPWGGGKICHTLEFFSNMVETPFFQSLPWFVLHQTNNCQGCLCKSKVSQKKSYSRKNHRGGGNLPPPMATRVNHSLSCWASLHWRCCKAKVHELEVQELEAQ